MTAGRTVAALPVHLYRWTLKPVIGLDCRFVPSCSQYALDAIAAHGPWRGTTLALRRLGRCHPWCAGGHDPVPPPRPSSNPA